MKNVSIWKVGKSLTELFEQAHAKLNLTLDVLGKRDDGYHNLRMIMHSVSLCDDVYVRIYEQPGEWSVDGTDPKMPTDENNLAWKAAAAYFADTGIHPELEIFLKKRIPSGAGMAGGSADAAAVLRALNRHFAYYDASELAKRALLVGSDVPYCLCGGCMLAEGRGERLTPLPQMPDCFVVIAKPAISISTPELFRAIDAVRILQRPNMVAACDALQRGSFSDLAQCMCNVFEPIVVAEYPQIRSILQTLCDCGALGAIMTGTGSACFGLFSSRAYAEKAFCMLSESGNRIFLEKPV